MDAEGYGKLQPLMDANRRLQSDTVDIGNINAIPVGEFLGAGLWQINKGLGSPFKSALKMALLVAYAASEVGQSELLADIFKRQVQENPNDFDKLDSYRLMVDRVLGYFAGIGDWTTVTLLQRCLFLKLRPQVARWWNSQRAPERRRDRVMLEYCRHWGWTQEEEDRW
ncbi:MAG: class I adenylate cyclase, partial [Planctomycetes bacterium]|nr:class I adenylate cyclase [Planctomycetota bacterium]